MFNEVKLLITNTSVSEDDIAASAAYLLKKQFVLRNETGDKTHFAFIDKHFVLFKKWFAFIGAKLEVNYEAGFIGYQPKESLSSLKMNETAALLILRVIYHDEKVAGSSEYNYITISGQLLVDEYRRLTGRDDLGQKGTFNAILKPLRQKSVIKFGEEDVETGIRDVIILPTIEMAINKDYADNLVDALINSESTQEAQKGKEEYDETN